MWKGDFVIEQLLGFNLSANALKLCVLPWKYLLNSSRNLLLVFVLIWEKKWVLRVHVFVCISFTRHLWRSAHLLYFIYLLHFGLIFEIISEAKRVLFGNKKKFSCLYDFILLWFVEYLSVHHLLWNEQSKYLHSNLLYQ